MLRDLGGGVDELGVAHTEVGDKADLHDLVDARVVVDNVGHGVNEADGLLGKGVARGGLAAKDEGRRRHVEVGIGDATVVDVHHFHDVHELSLVGMEALYLDIEDGVGVDDQTGLGLNVGGQTLLVGALGGAHGLQELGVVLETFKLLQLKGVLQPAVANGLGHELGVGGVGLGKEATVRDAVGLVVELLGRQGIEVLEHDVLDDVGVDLCHAVDAMAADHRQVGHANLAVPQNGGLAQTLLPALLRGVEGLVPTTADLVDDLVHAGEELGERADGPLLQSLGQDGVVGVAHDLRHDVPGVVPLELLLVDEDTHELGAAHGGVRVVSMDCHKLRQQVPVRAVLLLKGVEQAVDAGRDKQVLLLQA